MNILNKFTIKSLKLNKKRTIVTIIGIMLSTALICGVAGLVSSFQNSLIDWARTNDGNYHVTFKNVESNKAQYVTENQKEKASERFKNLAKQGRLGRPKKIVD